MQDFLALAGITKADPNKPLTPAECPDQISAFRRAFKAAMLLGRLKVRADQLAWYAAYAPAVGWIDLNVLPLSPVAGAGALFTAWQRTVALFALRDAIPGRQATLAVIFALARVAVPLENDVLMALWSATGWSLEDLTFLAGPSGLVPGSPALTPYPGAIRLAIPAPVGAAR